MTAIKPGTIIEGPAWPEPVEINLIVEVDDYIHIVGATTRSRNHIDQLIHRKEFERLTIAKSAPTFSVDPWKIFLALETRRYRYASEYDPLLAINTSKVDPLPY